MKTKHFPPFCGITLLAAAILLLTAGCKEEVRTYEPDWASLEKHPVPGWFEEARIGVFIHYSPAWFDMAMPDQFSAEEWIDLFKKAGAEYFVHTAKHNAGWCDWPSKISEQSAAEKNGPRDLVTPLVETARREGMKVGLYYNLMNGYQGVTTKMAGDPDSEPSEEYVMDFMFPLLQELVTTYQPDVLWTDGDWISTSEIWHSTEIVAWIYNWAESQNREICLTDRWGKDIRLATVGGTAVKYGDFWTLERRIMKDIVTVHPWESNLTMTNSWKYEEQEDFRTPPGELIRIMCDVISKGGNFLINIGPAPDGSITEGDRKCLLAIGDWLAVNGEAIYGSKPLKSMQEYDTDNDISLTKKLLLPEKINAPFEIIWSHFMAWSDQQGPVRYTVKGDYTYAIHHGWPGKELVLENISPTPGSEITMLGLDQPLSWNTEGSNIRIKLPAAPPCEHAFVLKIKLQ